MPRRMTRSFSIVSELFISRITRLFMSFLDSGHGGQIRDMDGDEVDGYDEGE
jgi:hypothetical protein